MIRSILPLLLAAAPAFSAEVYIGIDGSRKAGEKWPLGLAPFTAEDPRSREDLDFARMARDVVRTDLLFSRYFDVNDQPPAADLTEDAAAEAWKSRGAAFLLSARVSRNASQVSLSVKVQDLATKNTVLERYYRQNSRYWRSAVHRVSDDVVRQLTGKPGIAQSVIAFANSQTGQKEIYLVDYDGENLRALTSNRSINLLPSWSPDKKSLAFTSYKDGNPDLFLFDLERGSLRALSATQGLNLAGGFSPDGRRLAVTLSLGKNPNIFILNLSDSSRNRVTEHFGADSSPTFSPDGDSLAFVSDRAGNPQIYIADLSTNRTRRLTRLNWCDAPAWSPTGEWVTFAGRANNKDKIDIFLVDITGTRLIQLTHGEGSNEDPTWSPDGRFIAFTSTRGGKRRLYVMDADGSAPHALGDIAGSSYTPGWSP